LNLSLTITFTVISDKKTHYTYIHVKLTL